MIIFSYCKLYYTSAVVNTEKIYRILRQYTITMINSAPSQCLKRVGVPTRNLNTPQYFGRIFYRHEKYIYRFRTCDLEFTVISLSLYMNSDAERMNFVCLSHVIFVRTNIEINLIDFEVLQLIEIKIAVSI